MTTKTKTLWTFALSSIAIFMTALDNLVVTTALPVIKQQLGGGIDTLEWTVNGYTLTFAVLLLTGAALGDRFGRRRMFVAGIGIFTLGSAAAALAPSIQLLIAARAFQGIGGAIITPLTLTILTGAVPAEKRGVAFGAWSGIQGLAVAIGPLVGGAVTEGISWQWIFWLNVPIGLIALPFARTKLTESYGPNKSIDLPGIGLASAGLLGIVWALVRGNSAGWLSPEITGAAGLGHRRAGRIHRLGAAHRHADAADALLPQPRLRRRKRRLAGDVLRDVRIGVPAHPVAAAGHGLQPPAGRHPHPRLDRDASLRRPRRRRAV